MRDALAQLLAVLLAGLLTLTPSLARASDYIEVFTGHSRGPLDPPQPDYQTIPLRVAFTSDARPRLERIFNHLPPGTWEFQVEPFTDLIYRPHNNIELGLALGLKYTWNTGRGLAPYLKVSTGPLYTTQHVVGQATQFNFGSQASVGLQWKLNHGNALLVEARLRHFSNARIRVPNTGVNTDFILVGYRWATHKRCYREGCSCCN